jgi:alpha-L-arabinofuranosidase
MAVWYDVTRRGIAQQFTTAGMTSVRWPGGSDADAYHWQTHSLCGGGYADSRATFDNFMTYVAIPAQLSVEMTVNYGSNAACNGGGDPSEAAAWVDYANNVKGYGVKRWTIGNENYGSWEYDLHAKPHDAATYADAVANGFYPQIKAKDPTSVVGVVVNPGWSPAWDPTVLQNARYDYVELHWYAQAPGQENDTYLVKQAPQALTSVIKALKGELAAAGHAQTPIHLGELGSVYANPGKQTTSITQALFAGQVLGELLTAGVPRATWWLGNGGCSDASSGNFSSSLYGWQDFGGYMIFSDGTPEYGCSTATAVPAGTLLPTARAYQVMAKAVHDGEHVLGSTLGGASVNLRAYAMSDGNGYALVLFNLTQTKTAAVTVAVDGFTGSAAVTQTTYGKAEYDLSQGHLWVAPVTTQSAASGGTATVTLPPWSISAITIVP